MYEILGIVCENIASFYLMHVRLVFLDLSVINLKGSKYIDQSGCPTCSVTIDLEGMPGMCGTAC